MIKKRAHADDWFQEMAHLYAQGRFSAAGELYDRETDGVKEIPYGADLLRARVYLAKDENKAVAFLIKHAPAARSGQNRGRWALLLGIGYARMRDFESADRYFEMAQRTLATVPDRALIAYHIARRWMLEGREDEAFRFAEAMSLDKSRATRIKQVLLLSFIFSQQERYDEAAQELIAGINLIGSRRSEHLEEWFHAVQNLAALGRELPLEKAATIARAEVDQNVDWPTDFQPQRFQSLKAVGWSCALRGDLLGCFRYLRAAERVAPTAAFEAIVLLDRAHFARISGESNWALNEIAKAEAIADSLDWNALAGDERIGLLLLAEALASVSPEKARFFLARYKGLDRIRSPFHLFAFDHRIEAFAAYAEGAVRAVGGEPAAEESLRRAWVIFDRIGYNWRAGRTALRLFEVTQKDRWRHLAEDKLEAYPESWLRRELRERITPPPLPVQLPPMQRKVFEMLCRKMSTAEIAQELGLSQHTIRNHLKSVFKAYGVKSRAALIAEAAARGPLPAQ